MKILFGKIKMFNDNKTLPVVFTILLHVLICGSLDPHCHLKIDEDKTDFMHYIENGARLVYIYVNVSDIVTVLPRDEFTLNRLVEWIWVKNDFKHFLSYPIFIDYFTFGLMRTHVENAVVTAKAYHKSNCSNISDSDISKLLFSLSNVTFSGKLCHRNFENQLIKHNFTSYTGVSIGYDFDCLSHDSEVQESIHKSKAIYLVMIIVCMVISHYPMLLTIVFGTKTANEEIVTLTETDYPFIFRRGLLHFLFKSYTKEDLPNNMCLDRVHNFAKERDLRLEFIAISIRVSLLISVLFSMIFLLTKVYITSSNFVSDHLKEFPTVYQLDDLELSTIDKYETMMYIMSFLTVLVFSIFILHQSHSDDDYFLLMDIVRVPHCQFPVFIVPISAFLKDPENEIKRKNYSEDIYKLQYKLKKNKTKQKMSRTIASKIIDKFVLIFSLKFWCKVFLLPFWNLKIISCKSVFILAVNIIQFPINVAFILIFTLFPIFSSFWNVFFLTFSIFYEKLMKIIFKNMKRIFKNLKANKNTFQFVKSCNLYFAITLSLTYAVTFVIFLLKYCIVFHGISFCIQYFIYVGFIAIPHFDPTHFRILFFVTVAFSYLFKFIIDYLEFYRKVLLNILKIMEIQKLSVDNFDKIISHVFPVRNEIFIGIVKVLFTSFILAILYISLTDIGYIEGGNSFDLSTVFGFAFVLISPGILHKLIFSSSDGRIARKREDLIIFSTKILNDTSTKVSPELQESHDSKCHCLKDCCVCVCLLACGCLGKPRCTDQKGHCTCCFTVGGDNESFGIMRIKIENKRSYEISDYICTNNSSDDDDTETDRDSRSDDDTETECDSRSCHEDSSGPMISYKSSINMNQAKEHLYYIKMKTCSGNLNV